MLKILEVNSETLIQQAYDTFKEYSNYLNIDLEFQDFEQELNNLPEEYKPPHGCILLAFYNNALAGCVALRKFKDKICEMKRLHVKSEYRGRDIGKKLAELVIEKAREMGYKSMRLDTLHFIKEAISLYLSLGFKEIEAYRSNPFDGAKFFQLELQNI